MNRPFPWNELFSRQISRRVFTGFVGKFLGAVALWCLMPARRVWAIFAKDDPRSKRPFYFGYAIDIEKCIGCGRCVEACKVENNVPMEPFYFRTWVERYVIDQDHQLNVDSPNGGMNGFPDLPDEAKPHKTFFVPKLCNLCEASPCVQVCPVGATFKTEDGAILIDKEYCIGCRYCIQACPYGTRYFNPITQVADKCSLCYHRVKKGLKPACVEVCPTGTRMFGNYNDPEDPLNKFIASNKVQILKPHMGTQPKTVYKGLDKEVH